MESTEWGLIHGPNNCPSLRRLLHVGRRACHLGHGTWRLKRNRTRLKGDKAWTQRSPDDVNIRKFRSSRIEKETKPLLEAGPPGQPPPGQPSVRRLSDTS